MFGPTVIPPSTIIAVPVTHWDSSLGQIENHRGHIPWASDAGDSLSMVKCLRDCRGISEELLLCRARIRHPGVAIANASGNDFDEPAAGGFVCTVDSYRQPLSPGNSDRGTISPVSRIGALPGVSKPSRFLRSAA